LPFPFFARLRVYCHLLLFVGPMVALPPHPHLLSSTRKHLLLSFCGSGYGMHGYEFLFSCVFEFYCLSITLLFHVGFLCVSCSISSFDRSEPLPFYFPNLTSLWGSLYYMFFAGCKYVLFFSSLRILAFLFFLAGVGVLFSTNVNVGTDFLSPVCVFFSFSLSLFEPHPLPYSYHGPLIFFFHRVVCPVS